MKRIQIAIIFALLISNSKAQNVGVGTVTPTERLDVNGNVNVQGSLKVNGNAGQPGQVLRVNSDGTQSWANTFGYKRRKEFLNSGTWVVPDNIREIMVEAIGGGGGGAKGGGGGGGGYMFAVVKVAPGDIINITRFTGNGEGAINEGSLGQNGGNFQVFSVPAASRFSITSYGGSGGSSDKPGTGGSYAFIGDSTLFVKGYAGTEGCPTIETYTQITATDYVTMRKYGDGGICLYNPEIIQRGSYLVYNTSTLANVFINYASDSYNNAYYGTGGGGGNAPSGRWGYNGHLGLAAISW